jgi:hypothetical protein
LYDIVYISAQCVEVLELKGTGGLEWSAGKPDRVILGGRLSSCNYRILCCEHHFLLACNCEWTFIDASDDEIVFRVFHFLISSRRRYYQWANDTYLVPCMSDTSTTSTTSTEEHHPSCHLLATFNHPHVIHSLPTHLPQPSSRRSSHSATRARHRRHHIPLSALIDCTTLAPNKASSSPPFPLSHSPSVPPSVYARCLNGRPGDP